MAEHKSETEVPEKFLYTPSPLRSMSNYNPGGGCVAGYCDVKMANGYTKKVSEIKKGDRVSGMGGENNEVKCVVRTKIGESGVLFVRPMCGLEITPYHPINITGLWIFPANLTLPTPVFGVEFVYSFVLDGGHVVVVNDIKCICLGHNINDGAARHEYLGTSKVIDDLKRAKGWESGLVTLKEGAFLRSVETTLTDSLDLSKEIYP